jgi:drug/metabolite transporter (DMT)-like permease
MSAAIGFALVSLLFAGVNDVVFKRYSRQVRSRGMFILGIGIVWGILQLLALVIQGQQVDLATPTLAFGIAAGVMVTLSNLLLLESLTHLDVSLGSTIYRLNTVGVVILSFIFLGEPMHPVKLLGIGFGVIAVLYLYRDRPAHIEVHALSLFFWLAVSASVLRAGFGVTFKAGLSQGGHAPTMMLIAALSWIIGGFCYAWLRERRIRITRKKLGYSALSGVLVFVIVNSLTLALERGQASIVVPIANLSFIVALALSVAMKMERFTMPKTLATVCAAVSIFLLAQLS